MLPPGSDVASEVVDPPTGLRRLGDTIAFEPSMMITLTVAAVVMPTKEAAAINGLDRCCGQR